MKPEAKKLLSTARRALNAASVTLAQRGAKSGALSSADRIKQISVGIAVDYISWAESMTDISYGSQKERTSPRHDSITESLRFTQLWTAANSLFSRDEVLNCAGGIGPFSKIEAVRFKTLYAVAAVEPATENASMAILLQLLDMECQSKGLVAQLGTGNPTMWEVIHTKYSRPEDRTRGIGKTISDAIAAGTFPRPDAATLIYGARNWTVHGMLVTNFFRGSPAKYITFINNIIFLLSASLAGAAQKIEANV